MDRLPVNGSMAQLAARDIYGIFNTLFRDSYYHAEIDSVDDTRLQEITALFGAPWSNDMPVMTVAKTSNPRFIAETEEMIPAHNECAYSQNPPRLLALYCVENSADDGAFFLVSPGMLIDKLGEEHLPSLRGARYRCQMSRETPAFETTLMRETGIGEQIILTTVGAMGGGSTYQLINPVDTHSATTLDKLSTVVNDPRNRHRHAWKTGDFIVVDNLRLMHGREAFSGGNRELRHIRLA